MTTTFRRPAPMVRTAHGGGDQSKVYHCYSCGSGAVTAGSDGSVSCGYCQAVFSVKVHPQHPNMPQTVNGQPIDIPGVSPEEGTGQGPDVPQDEALADPTGQDPTDAPQDAGGPSGGFSDADLEEFMTSTGQRLDRKHYVQHLALTEASLPERDRVLTAVRTANRAGGEATGVHWIDHRPNGTDRLLSTHGDADEAYDAAREIARGAALSFGIGGIATDVPGSRFEIWHNGAHIADVMTQGAIHG